MSKAIPEFDIELLSAYLDRELDADGIRRAEKLLTENESARAWYASIQQQRLSLKRSLNPVMDTKIPDRLLQGRQKNIRLASLPSIAATLIIGLILGWQLKPSVVIHQQQAFGYHQVYAAELRHPVEVDASQESHLLAWLSNRLGHNVQAPNFQRFGFQLLGGRLLAELSNPSAQLMYQRDDGVRLTLYVSLAQNPTDRSFAFEQQDALNAFFWQSKELSFGIVSTLDQSVLSEIANSSYQQLL